MGEEKGLRLISESINIAHSKTSNFKTGSMIELTAGQGTSLGYRFEQIKMIIDLVDDKSRMSVCIDTAHIFAAGYDIRSKENYDGVMQEFDDIIGLNLLRCIHMNDSKKGTGSKVDRHEHIGKGLIGKEGFKNIMNDKRILHVQKILETLKGKEQLEVIKNLRVLRSLIKKRD